ncbi:MAG: hypothetical protein B2I17_01370 [Thermoplasmatales archaeon B_DKE]|nr:MAG: hypothetical protein B2I17_01370 [Thermoplasmatales archaeon B_DKE]
MVDVILTVIIGIMLSIIPYMTEKSIVFGVRTPPEYRDSEVIIRSRKTYVVSVLVITLILSAVQVLIIPQSFVLLLSIFPLFVVLIAFFVYLPLHYAIERTKKSENWADKSNQSVSATFVSGRSNPFPWVYAVPGFMVLLAIFIIGIMDYNNMPQVLATHFGANGQPNQYSAKSIGTVFFTGFLGIGLTVGMTLLAYPISISSFRVDSSSNAALERSVIFRSRMTRMILIMPVFIDLTMMISEFEIWGLIGHVQTTLILILAPIFAMFALVLSVTLITGQAGSNLRMVSGADGAPGITGYKDSIKSASTKDDDSSWRAGVIYFNKNDARFMVPKRFGVGYTLNFAHPGSIAIIAAILCVPIILILALPH